MRSSDFSLYARAPLYNLFFDVYVVFVDSIRSCHGPTRVSPLNFALLQLWLFFIFVTDFWVLGLAQFVHVDDFVCHWR